jgi:hypothetical protein
MAISSDFQFSQASLQDFSDCRRRFYYRYYQRLSWPALEAEPALANEQWIKQGADFHHMVHQFILGIPAERLTETASGNLAVWWRSFLEQVPFDRKGKLYPERLLAADLAGRRLVAKYDLIVVNPDGSIDIFDWKTSRKFPNRTWIAERLQTKVYPYVIAQAGELLGGEQVDPGKVRMVYWTVSQPEQPIVFDYSERQMQADEIQLRKLIDEIVSREEIEQFPLTSEERHCRFCIYRSLCARGETAGNFEEETLDYEIDQDFDLDFDLIEEIEF